MTGRDRSTHESPAKTSGDVAHLFPPDAPGRKPGAKIISPATLTDQLGELRALIKRATAEEKAMTAEVLATLTTIGQIEVRGERFIATKGSRENLTVDPGLFIEAVGLTKALAAIAVRMEPARALLAGDDLAAISESVSVPVLYVKERSK